MKIKNWTKRIKFPPLLFFLGLVLIFSFFQGYMLFTEIVKEKGIVEEIELRTIQFAFIPDTIQVVRGTKIVIYVVESSFNKEPGYALHTFTLPDYGISVNLPEGIGTKEHPIAKIEFIADKVGEFVFECASYCGTGHPNMRGKLIVTERGMIVAKPTMLELKDINATLQVLKLENTLPTSPQYFTENDLEYLMLVVQREAGAVYALNGKTLEGLKNITDLGVRPHVINYNPIERRWAYVISRDGWISKIDLWSLEVVRKIRVGFDSRGLAISDDGKYIIAGNYEPNTAVILDSLSLEPLKVIQTFGVDPDGEAVKSRVCATLESGRYGYFIIALKEAGQVWIIDYKNKNFPIIATIENVGRILHDGWLTEDERYFMIASQKDNTIAIIDLEALSLIKKLPTPPTPHPGPGSIYREYAFAPSISEANITVIDTRSWEIVKYIWPKGINVKAGGGLFITQVPPTVRDKMPYLWSDIVFGPYNGTLFIIDARSLEVIKVIKDPNLGYGKRALHPEYTVDGKYVFVSVWDANKLLIFDATTFELVKVVDKVMTPTGIFGAWRVHIPGL